MDMNKNDEDKNNMHKKGTKKTIQYELNPSSQLLFEDALKRCINKYNGSRVPLKTKYAPPNKQSPFGDFPKSYLPKKKSDYNLINIEAHQVANSVTNFPNGNKGKNFSKTAAFSSLTKAPTDKPPRAGAFHPRKIPVSEQALNAMYAFCTTPVTEGTIAMYVSVKYISTDKAGLGAKKIAESLTFLPPHARDFSHELGGISLKF